MTTARNAAVVGALVILSLARAAEGQPADAARGFLSAYRFHLNAARLAAADRQFDWDTAFGGDVDLVDYGTGRLNFLADYTAVLGSELRPFDPNQSAYRLDGSGTWRLGGGELALVFHHVSRHLSDRAKVAPIDWNMLGVAYTHVVDRGLSRVVLTAGAFRVVKRSSVDYTGELRGGARFEQVLRPQVAAYAAGNGIIVTVAPSILGRERQRGGRIEAGIRLLGRAGAIELFGGYERRIDANPFDGRTRTWALAGFRLVGGR